MQSHGIRWAVLLEGQFTQGSCSQQLPCTRQVQRCCQLFTTKLVFWKDRLTGKLLSEQLFMWLAVIG